MMSAATLYRRYPDYDAFVSASTSLPGVREGDPGVEWHAWGLDGVVFRVRAGLDANALDPELLQACGWRAPLHEVREGDWLRYLPDENAADGGFRELEGLVMRVLHTEGGRPVYELLLPELDDSGTALKRRRIFAGSGVIEIRTRAEGNSVLLGDQRLRVSAQSWHDMKAGEMLDACQRAEKLRQEEDRRPRYLVMSGREHEVCDLPPALIRQFNEANDDGRVLIVTDALSGHGRYQSYEPGHSVTYNGAWRAVRAGPAGEDPILQALRHRQDNCIILMTHAAQRELQLRNDELHAQRAVDDWFSGLARDVHQRRTECRQRLQEALAPVKLTRLRVDVSTAQGLVEVDAWRVGSLAVHRALDGHGWTLSLMPSGLSMLTNIAALGAAKQIAARFSLQAGIESLSAGNSFEEQFARIRAIRLALYEQNAKGESINDPLAFAELDESQWLHADSRKYCVQVNEMQAQRLSEQLRCDFRRDGDAYSIEPSLEKMIHLAAYMEELLPTNPALQPEKPAVDDGPSP